MAVVHFLVAHVVHCFCVSFNSCCLQTLKTVYTEDGVMRGLYRGLSINYLRVVPQVSVMFGVYELSRQLLTTA